MRSGRSSIVPFLLAGGGIFAVVMIGKISTLKALSFKIKGVRFDASDSDPLLFLDIGIQNPTARTITIKAISGTVSVDQNNVARVSQDKTATILPFNETLYTVPFRIDLTNTIQKIVDLIQNGTTETVVRFIGSVNLEGILFPVNVSYKLL